MDSELWVSQNKREDAFIKEQMHQFDSSMFKYFAIQFIFIGINILIVFFVYSLMNKKSKQLEIEKIRMYEINKSKSTFLSNMSHDIRTPMNAIIGFTNLALQDDVTRSTMVDYLNKIKLSSSHLLSLINDVLEMSRIESGKIELQETLVHIPELLHDICTIIVGQVEAKQHELELNAVNVKNETIYCDKLRLNQVLLNILSNSIKYTPSGGKISISIEEKGAVTDGYSTYEIRVKDNGMGMTPEFAKKIFNAFERERNSTISGIQGTGLGMAITKRIVDLMQGTIVVETEKGKGTDFIVTLRLRVSM